MQIQMYVFTQGKLRNFVMANIIYLKTNERKIQVFVKSFLTASVYYLPEYMDAPF